MPKASVSRPSGPVSMAVLLALALPAGPAMGQGLAIYARTPTGLPETLFDTGPQDASAQLAGQCLDDGLSVVTQDDGAVTCQVPDDREAGARADLGQAGRSGNPIFYRFQVEERAAASRVLASGWQEMAGFWGGTDQREFDDPVFHNALVDLMLKAGGRLPPGTRFPNHAMIGADFVARARPQQSLEVTDVEPESPAMRAGLQSGDLVTRIANRRTRTLEDLNRSLVEAASAATFEIRFLRDGREGVALLKSEFRPAVAAPVLAETEETKVAADLATAEPVAPSVAATPTALSAGMPATVQPGAPMPGMVSPQMMPAYPVQVYQGQAYSAAPSMAYPGVPLTYAVPPQYAPPHMIPQGGVTPLAASPGAAAPAANAPALPAGGFSVADELVKFAALLKEGVITQTEFDAQKARLLTQ